MRADEWGGYRSLRLVAQNCILLWSLDIPPINPKGIAPQSPGLPSLRGYPGSQAATSSTLKGLRLLAAARCVLTVRQNEDATPLGLIVFGPITQGSSFLATLGFEAKSLWDLPKEMSKPQLAIGRLEPTM